MIEFDDVKPGTELIFEYVTSGKTTRGVVEEVQHESFTVKWEDEEHLITYHRGALNSDFVHITIASTRKTNISRKEITKAVENAVMLGIKYRDKTFSRKELIERIDELLKKLFQDG